MLAHAVAGPDEVRLGSVARWEGHGAIAVERVHKGEEMWQEPGRGSFVAGAEETDGVEEVVEVGRELFEADGVRRVDED